jgi:DNA polymerase III subunit gamma/tau
LAHAALARTYRPRSFAEVATQAHVSETLRRAVASDRVGHAYLFSGPRGVGKTTLARILAMALNCPRRTPAGEPCGECESCSRIWSGHTSLDVVEIDAASNRGVEDARDLRERAMYAPSEEGRFKVYIVDEAHMLTREAWNALLKILEEPPPRVIFVFATTEPQKIQQLAAPILSRCQSFAFRRIGQADILDRLKVVLAREGVAAPEDALRLVARRADGGMRDALSLLDQVLALTGGEVTAESTRRVLGLVEEERFLELLSLLSDRRAAEIFPVVERLLDEGYDLVEFHQGLVDSLRALLQLRLDSGAQPDLPEALRGEFAVMSERFEPADLVRMLALASELESGGALRRSAHPRVLVELLLLRLSYMDRTVDLEQLLRAMGGAPPPEEDGRGGGGDTSGRSRPSSPTSSRPPAENRRVEAEALRGGKSDQGPPDFAGEPLSEPDGESELGSPWSRMLEGSVEPGRGRIGHDAVRQDRLRELLSREPLLRQAVEALDLELLD